MTAPEPTVARADKERALATLTAVWNDRGIEPAALLAENTTLQASDRRIGTLGLVSTVGDEPEDRLFTDPLILGEAIGRGGMGEVRSAHHPALRREVAVKRTLGAASRDGEEALLKEAWVGAHVEHPNVVPVHALVRSPDDGRPAMVMQLVTGKSWLAALVPPAEEAERDAYLDRQLGVLRRVCQATAFAHRRGVLHLDLKPDNVMIGPHDEVYVLDWGLAAGFGEEAPDWLARAEDIKRISGTPGYMAPELVAADGASIGPWTDVYLLGAVLHHVLTGEPLHRGDSMMEILAAAFLSEPPEFAGWVPGELQALIAKATSPFPRERFQDVASFRAALDAYIAHRPAERLLRGLRTALLDAESRVAERTADDPSVEATLAGCELAIEEVGRAYPGLPELADLRRRVFGVRLAHAERSEDPRVVRAALTRTAKVTDPELRKRRDALVDRLDSRERELEGLEELARELDASLGAADRSRTWRLLGFLWFVVCFVYGALERASVLTVSYRMLFQQAGIMVAVLVPFTFWLRDRLLRNRVGRRLSGGLAYCGVAVEILFLGGYLLDVPVRHVLLLTMLCYAYVFLVIGIAIDRRILPGAFIFLGAMAASVLVPAYVHEAIGAAGFATVLVATRGWAPAAPRATA